MSEYNLLDTRSFDRFIRSENDIKERYNQISDRYKEIVRTLLKDWKGQGAEAFEDDSKTVAANITGIGDVLSTMCDTLRDCRDVFGECDSSLANQNRNAL